jgi:hypothetical protein
VQPNSGIGLYVAGNMHLIELTGGAVPAAGAVWSLRDYVGAIAGGGCDVGCGAGNYGDYIFTPYTVQPLSATGVDLRVNYQVTNEVALSTDRDLRAVHTVPDPFYVTNEFESTADNKVI